MLCIITHSNYYINYTIYNQFDILFRSLETRTEKLTAALKMFIQFRSLFCYTSCSLLICDSGTGTIRQLRQIRKRSRPTGIRTYPLPAVQWKDNQNTSEMVSRKRSDGESEFYSPSLHRTRASLELSRVPHISTTYQHTMYTQLGRTAFSAPDQAVFLFPLLSISDRGITPIYLFRGGLADEVPGGTTRRSDGWQDSSSTVTRLDDIISACLRG